MFDSYTRDSHKIFNSAENRMLRLQNVIFGGTKDVVEDFHVHFTINFSLLVFKSLFKTEISKLRHTFSSHVVSRIYSIHEHIS